MATGRGLAGVPRERWHVPPLLKGSHQCLAGLALPMLLGAAGPHPPPAPGTPGRLLSPPRSERCFLGLVPTQWCPAASWGRDLAPGRGVPGELGSSASTGPSPHPWRSPWATPFPAQPDCPPPPRSTAAIASLGSHPGLDPCHQRAHTRCASPASWGGGGPGSESHVWPCSAVEKARRKSPRSSRRVSWRGGQERAMGRGGGGGCPGARGGRGTAAHGEPHTDPQGARPTTFAHSPMGITRTHTHRHAHMYTDSHT